MEQNFTTGYIFRKLLRFQQKSKDCVLVARNMQLPVVLSV